MKWGLRHAHVEGEMILAAWGDTPAWAALSAVLSALAQNDALVDGAIDAAEKAGCPDDLVDHLHEINNALYRRRLRAGLTPATQAITASPDLARAAVEMGALSFEPHPEGVAVPGDAGAMADHKGHGCELDPELGRGDPLVDLAAAQAAVDAWSLSDVLTRLADAADILFDRHDYDGDGYEQVATARDVARIYAASLAAGSSCPESEARRLRAVLFAANNALVDASLGDHEHQIAFHADTLPAEHRRVARAAERALDILSPVVAEMVEPEIEALADAMFPEVDERGLPRLSAEQADRFVDSLTRPGLLLEKTQTVLMGEAAEVLWGSNLSIAEGEEPTPVAVVREATGQIRPRFHAEGKWRVPAHDFGYQIMEAWALARVGPATPITSPPAMPPSEVEIEEAVGDLPRLR